MYYDPEIDRTWNGQIQYMFILLHFSEYFWKHKIILVGSKSEKFRGVSAFQWFCWRRSAGILSSAWLASIKPGRRIQHYKSMISRWPAGVSLDFPGSIRQFVPFEWLKKSQMLVNVTPIFPINHHIFPINHHIFPINHHKISWNPLIKSLWKTT